MAVTEISGHTPAAERVLDAAGRLFYGEGIRAVGMEAVAAEAGVTKKTIYDRFGSKDTLVAAYLRRRDERWRAWLNEELGSGTDPAAQLLLVFDALHSWMRDAQRGCGFVNAHAELADPEHPGRAVIVEQKTWMRELFTGLAQQAGLRAPSKVGMQLLMLFEGVSVVQSVGVEQHSVAAAKQAVATLIAAAQP